MPNHFHAILFLINEIKGTASRAPTKREFGKSVSGSLSTILSGFKSGVAKRINRLLNHNLEGLWQRSFFEHVIRDEESLVLIREYILTNPFRWELDRENLQRTGDDEFDHWLGGFSR
jgi:putative transposase